jgi:hypothetical protein
LTRQSVDGVEDKVCNDRGRPREIQSKNPEKVGKIQKMTYLVVGHRGLDELRAMQSKQMVPQVGGVAFRQCRVTVVTLRDLYTLTRQVLMSEV